MPVPRRMQCHAGCKRTCVTRRRQQHANIANTVARAQTSDTHTQLGSAWRCARELTAFGGIVRRERRICWKCEPWRKRPDARRSCRPRSSHATDARRREARPRTGQELQLVEHGAKSIDSDDLRAQEGASGSKRHSHSKGVANLVRVEGATKLPQCKSKFAHAE